MNPNRKIPTLQDGEVVVWESNACVRYLAARYGAGSLWPEDPARRALSDVWMDWQQTTIQPDMTPIFWNLVRTPRAAARHGGGEGRGPADRPLWQILDRHLADRRFVAGDTLTMGDIPVGCHWWRYANLPVEKPSLPNVERWGKELQERDGYRREVALPLT